MTRLEDIDPHRYWRFAGPAAVAGALLCAALIATSYRAVDAVVPPGATILLFVGVVVVHLGTVHTLFSLRRSGGNADANAFARRLVRSPLILALPAFWLVGMTTVATLDGTPERHDGRYFLDLRGALTEVPEAVFDDQQRRHLRFRSSVAGAFYTVAVLAWAAYASLRRRPERAPRSEAPGGGDDFFFG